MLRELRVYTYWYVRIGRKRQKCYKLVLYYYELLEWRISDRETSGRRDPALTTKVLLLEPLYLGKVDSSSCLVQANSDVISATLKL